MPGSPLYTPGLCANCDSLAVTARRPLYCSDRCQQAAELVRYARRCKRDGRLATDHEVRDAIQARLALIVGGGYRKREREVPEEVRAEVFRRSGGLCQNCGVALDFAARHGGTAATIQHIDGDSNDLSNLKAFCWACNTSDALSKVDETAPGSPEEALAGELQARWTAREPLRICDDDQRWSSVWRDLARSTTQLIREQDSEYDSLSDEDLPGFMGWTEQGTPIQEF